MKFLLILSSLLFSTLALGHDGGLDKFGCHYDNGKHTYHCHNGILNGLEFDSMEKMLLAMRDTAGAPSRTYVVLGKVISITDGDTITILVNNRPAKIRLAEIDAPEQHQAYGMKAKQYIGNLIFGKKVRVNVDDMDEYGHLLGRVYINKLDVNADLVEKGYAWANLQYAEDSNLARLEVLARKNKRGLWAGPNPEPPWQWRHMHPH